MAKPSLSHKQKELLTIWGTRYQEWCALIRAMSPEDLRELHTAASNVTQTNCWFASYAVAPIVKDMIHQHVGYLTVKEIKDADAAEDEDGGPQ